MIQVEILTVFTTYHSNQLDLLKDLLVDLIQRQPLSNPLTDEQILVQSPGMAQWLRQEIAETVGISAAINFPLPASFLWDTFVKVLPDVPKRSAFNKEAMTWKLVSLLPEMMHNESFTPLKRYLENDEDGVRCYQLAGKVADIFDQYLVYRPEWVAEWEKGKNTWAESQLWQPELWRALTRKTLDAGQPHWHRANMHQSFLSQLSQGQHSNKLPKRLFVFGISAMPPHFIETLKALGEETDVHLMICNPCQYYWGDEKDPKYLAKLSARLFSKRMASSQTSEPGSFTFNEQENEQGNPLLASMGKLGRDYIHQLYELEGQEVIAFVDGKEDSLLHRVQKDILELTNQSSNPSPASNAIKSTDKKDTSLVFHSCHSPMREVEVLHDQLLFMLEENQNLSPKDIVVMLPDVDLYSPWINAVFGGLSEHYHDPRYIPFSISDRSASNEYPLLTGILQLLDIDKDRCTASELLELLEIPAIMRHFSFTEEGYERIRLWVDEAGIRWGLNPEHQQGFNIPPSENNSWLFGLKRMLLGYALPEESGLFDNTLPLDVAQGMNAVLSGQLAAFIEQAERLASQLSQDRTISQWVVLINELIDAFITPDEDDEYPLKLVRDALEYLSTQLSDADYQQTLSRPIMLDYLTDKLNSERSSQKFLVGKVNFCTLMPMRSIPFKVVCLLGMNDGAYPRSIPPAGFDLMVQHPRRGDRSRREDDRYLFLEALLSARETLYISYVGHSIKDNSERIPSVLVSELIDYCQQYFEEPETAASSFITEHRLQPFSPANFDDTGPLFSYAKEWLPIASGRTQDHESFMQVPLTEQDLPEEIELSELIRFFRNPAQYFCNRRLRVHFDAIEEQLEDEEPFELNHLETYFIKQELSEELLSNQEIERFTKELYATGKLPHGAFGELYLEDQYNIVKPLTDEVGNALTKPKNDIDITIDITIDISIDIHIDGTLKNKKIPLTGWLRHHYASGLIRFRPAKMKAKDILSAWIEHLCYCASTQSPGSTQLFTQDQKATFSAIESTEAIVQLKKLTGLYIKGLNSPLPFFPATAHKWLDTLLQKGDNEKAESSALDSFYGNYNFPGEGDNAYIYRVHPKLEPVFDDLKTHARDIFCPAFDPLTMEKRGAK